jgi:hypothetical protein
MNFLHEIWNSIDRLGKLIEWANWGIAATLLAAFVCTVIVIKASGRKDELAAAEDLIKAQRIAETSERAAKLEVEAARLRLQLEQEIQKHAQRILTDSQKEILASELKGKVSKVTFVVQRDQESRAFALQLEIIFQEAGAELTVYAMPPGDVPPAFFGVMMYKPGGITDEKDLKEDPVFKALKGANLFSGTAAKPFASFDGIKEPPLLPLADRYVLYITQKPPW